MSARLIVVSNRLPLALERSEAGMEARASSGGLVAALGAVLRQRSALWLGWDGADAADHTEPAISAFARRLGYELQRIPLTAEERTRFYAGFSNEIIWPLFHDLQSRCNFDPSYWQSYLEVNLKFARATAEQLHGRELVWVHDYHLMDVARCLRAAGVKNRIAYFHHIPFPPPDIFAKLPWRRELLHSLLDYDLVGLQTPHDVRNLVACARRFLGRVTVRREQGTLLLRTSDSFLRVESFPVGVHYRELSSQAASRPLTARAEHVRLDIGTEHVLLGVDRLDYTKGIPQRLQAFDTLLQRSPELHGRVTLVQLAVPSREDIPQYRELRLELERLVSAINGRHGRPGWTPVQYLYRQVPLEELLAYYRAADVCLVTPLRDGMNLVAKEYCAAKVDGNGVLVLSEFAGATAQLANGALLVNPYDVEGTAAAIARACHMPGDERRTRMQHLRRVVRRFDVFDWADSFLRLAARERPEDCAAERSRAVEAAARAS